MLADSGEPRRCEARPRSSGSDLGIRDAGRGACLRGQECRFSAVLLIHICCLPTRFEGLMNLLWKTVSVPSELPSAEPLSTRRLVFPVDGRRSPQKTLKLCKKVYEAGETPPEACVPRE